ncbi:MAG TPA: ice-binding family protein [bacterium]|jgi:hypothetical protein|nr:ice-binding family protein [bacterium]
MRKSIGIERGWAGLFLGLYCMASAAFGSSPLPVNLASAGNFSVLAKTGIQGASGTAVLGNMGIAPAQASYITGFGLILSPSQQYSTSSLVSGKVYAVNYAAPSPAMMNTAVGDMMNAYADAQGRTPGVTELGAGNISGLTLVAGVYYWSTGVLVDTDLTLSGSATDVWIFQIAQTLTLADGIHINLIGGAQASNVFWQVAQGSSLGTNSIFNGSILDQTAIVVKTGATMNGKALAQTAVTVDGSSIKSATNGYLAPGGPGGDPAPIAYPSPARGGVVTVLYTMDQPGRASFKVWNENGDLAATLEEDEPSGVQKTQIPVNRFAPGVYLYRVDITYDSGATSDLGLQKFAVAK